ncbi:MAG TPA: DMT family transporter [Bryobacteraceae bacterium]|nr:DMT family transporter [Bryobacteraceae bacterium]
MKPAHRLAELGLALVCLLWGSTFVLVKNALDDISPVLFIGIRFSIATIVLGGVYAMRRKPGKVTWRGGLVAGLFLFIGYFLQTVGLRYTTPAKSGFITGLYIVLVPLLLAAVYRKAPGLSEWIGVVLATIGMGLLTLSTTKFEVGYGEALTVGCALAFAVHILLLGHYSKTMPTEWLTLLQVGTCAVVGLATFPVIEDPLVRWKPDVIIALTVTSLLATALAFYVQTWGQKYTTPTRAALIFSLEPVFAWLTSYVFENEVLTRQAFAGAACILAGILVVELKPLDRRDSAAI